MKLLLQCNYVNPLDNYYL